LCRLGRFHEVSQNGRCEIPTTGFVCPTATASWGHGGVLAASHQCRPSDRSSQRGRYRRDRQSGFRGTWTLLDTVSRRKRSGVLETGALQTSFLCTSLTALGSAFGDSFPAGCSSERSASADARSSTLGSASTATTARRANAAVSGGHNAGTRLFSFWTKGSRSSSPLGGFTPVEP
jgi:hypothetical protein